MISEILTGHPSTPEMISEILTGIRDSGNGFRDSDEASETPEMVSEILTGHPDTPEMVSEILMEHPELPSLLFAISTLFTGLSIHRNHYHDHLLI